MAGGGPAADASGVYLLTGNGRFDTNLTGNGFPMSGDFGNSFLKLSLANATLDIADYFAMYNAVSESNADEDLGSGGAMLLPDVTDGTGAGREPRRSRWYVRPQALAERLAATLREVGL